MDEDWIASVRCTKSDRPGLHEALLIQSSAVPGLLNDLR